MKLKTNFMKHLMGIMCVSILVIGCSPDDGEDGATGPQGLQGEQGIVGPQGPEGSQGEDGETGTANVIYSEWFNTELSNSIVSSAASFTVNEPRINPDMLNYGTILVYGRRVDIGEGGNIVYPLPIVFGANRQQSYYFRAQSETIRISVSANQPGGNVGDGAFLEQYRYVLIPGGQSTNGNSGSGGLTGKTSTTDYSKMSYEEVVAHFNISE